MNIKINETRIDSCESYKYLGVIFDNNLSWKPHVDYICGKISKACGALSKIRHSVDLETLKTVYYSLVHSYLHYGITTWGSASENVLKPLHTFVEPIFNFLEILDFQQLLHLETGKFVYKSKNELLPINTLINHFERSSSNHNYNLRNRANGQLVAPVSLLSSFKKKSLYIQGIDLWSNLPDSIKLSESINIFKKRFKSHLLQDNSDGL